jgi:predicted TPR repeat methyltransferase
LGTLFTRFDHLDTLFSCFDHLDTLIFIFWTPGSMVMSPMNKPLGEQHLFDSGCGTGNYVASLMDKVGDITMSDFSEGMLEKARLKFKGDPKIKGIDQADSTLLPYTDAMFDAVISNQVCPLSHFAFYFDSNDRHTLFNSLLGGAAH